MYFLDNAMKPSSNFFSKFVGPLLLKSKKRFVFLAMGVVMFAIVGGFVIYSFIFLISTFDKILATQLISPPISRFDIQGFEQLDLIK